MERLINCLPNSSEYTAEITEKLKTVLKREGFTVSDVYNEKAELNISIGGDGAFLHAVRNSNFSKIPFVGINTGTLGFFPEIIPDHIENFVFAYKSYNYQINEISLIECHVNCSDSIFMTYAINDIAIKRHDLKTAHLDLFFNDTYLQTISGDGVIISSPLGSSAYNFSAGGALVYPSLKTLQIIPLAPLISNAYRCLSSSLIVPSEFEVKIVPEEKKNATLSLVVDGKVYEMDNIDVVRCFTSNKIINQITIGDFNYWNVIRDKLL